MTSDAGRLARSSGLTVALTLLPWAATWAQDTGRFPSSGDNMGMVVEYSLEGVEVSGTQEDTPPMTWRRTLAGRVVSGRVAVRGTVSLAQPGYPKCGTEHGDFFHTFRAVISSGDQRDEMVFEPPCGGATYPRSFEVGVEVPAGAAGVEVRVEAVYLNPRFGNRFSQLWGDFAHAPVLEAVGPAAAPAGQPKTGRQPQAGASDPRVARALDAVGVRYEVDADGDYRVTLGWEEDGRSQLLWVNSRVTTLGGVDIREVWSIGYRTDGGGIPPSIADRLLKDNATFKIGAWEVGTNRGLPVARFVARIPADCSSEFLHAVVRAVAVNADELEKELLRSDDL